jgi:hypothetical protein
LKVGETQLQRFSAKTGAVVIKGLSEVGVLQGLYGTKIVVEAHELTDASDGTRADGLTIEVIDGERLGGKSTSYIDYDEIESLIAGMVYIAKVDKSVSRMANFQADYRTRGDLRLSSFSRDDGTIMFAVSSGTIGGTTAYLPTGRATELRELIQSAKSTIISARPATSKR